MKRREEMLEKLWLEEEGRSSSDVERWKSKRRSKRGKMEKRNEGIRRKTKRKGVEVET